MNRCWANVALKGTEAERGYTQTSGEKCIWRQLTGNYAFFSLFVAAATAATI